MDRTILHGRDPDLYGFLILTDHDIPASEIWDQLKYWTEQYLEFGENRTKISHRVLDNMIDYRLETERLEGYAPCFCHKGCCSCCYQPVACTDEEAMLIAHHCRENSVPLDKDRLRRQQRFMLFDKEGNFTGAPEWTSQTEEDQSCIFLDAQERTCRIWEVRPFVCRAHLAEKTDRYCRSSTGAPDPRSSGIHYPECSFLLSAIFSFHHDSVGKMMGPLLCDD